jgi:putative ABC transport system permease protein
MRRAFWLRWAWRDLKERWTVVLATGLVLAIGTGLFATLGAMKAWRIASADASFAALNSHDLRVAAVEGSFVDSGRLRAVADGVPGVAQAQERLSLPSQIDASRPGAPVLVAGRIVGMDLSAAPPIDALGRYRGRALRRDDAGKPVAALERSFASYHRLPATGTLHVTGGELRYVGHAMAPEWFVVAREGAAWGAEASFGVVFTSLQTAQRLAGRAGEVNEVVLRMEPGRDVVGTTAAVERAFASELPDIGVTVTTRDGEDAHGFLYRDAENDQRVMLVFAVLILLGAGLGAFNLVGRIVEAQRREIGIGMALGVDPARLAIRPLLLALQVGVLGMVIGIGVAIGTAELFKPLLREMLPLPVIETPFQRGFFLLGAALGVAVPLGAAMLPVWRGVRVAPVEAIRIGFRSAKGAGLAGLMRRVPVPGRSLSQMPLRNLLRAPRRTLMTVTGFGAVISVVIALGGMIDSFDTTVQRALDDAGRGGRDRTIVTLDRPRAIGSTEVRAVAGDPAVGTAEPGLRLPASVVGPGGSVEVGLDLIDADSRLWRPSFEAGGLRAGDRGLVLSRRAAEDLDVRVGDSVTLRHPVRTGAATLGSADTRARVAGIHANPFRHVAFADAGWASAMGLAGTANVMAVLPAAGATPREVQSALFGRPGVASVEEAAIASRTLDDALDQFGSVLQIGWIFALALGLLMAFNATAINNDERRREHATMFAFGVRTRSVLRVNVLENVAVGILATLVGLALGSAILGWIVGSLVRETFPDLAVQVAIAPGTLTAAALVGVVALALAPIVTLHRLRVMDVPSTLRVME